ncbi:MAG: lmo0937 family membrane protein [Lewinellaceae bacterium]|nr:lmo0937 family membrane protein [Lewinellaceae bacterium]
MRDLLWLIAIILFVGWLLGYQGCGAAMGDYIHILLVLAIIVVLIRLISGRRI